MNSNPLVPSNNAADAEEVLAAPRRAALKRLTLGAALTVASAPMTAAASSLLAGARANQAIPTGGNVGGICPGLPQYRARGVDPRNGLTSPVLDPLNDMKGFLNIGFSLIPVYGTVINAVINTIWPTNSQDIWALLVDKIQALIDESIEKSVLNDLQNAISGLQNVLSTYATFVTKYPKNPSPGDTNNLITWAGNVHSQFEKSAPAFMNPVTPGWQNKILPLFAQMANLHLVFLRDIVWNGHQVFDAGIVSGYQSEFAKYNAEYVKHVDDTLPGVLQAFADTYARETQAPIPDDAWHDKSLQPGVSAVAWGAWNAKMQQNVATSQLTHLVQDYRQLWPAMGNSDPNRKPVELTRELLFGPYGAPDWQDIGYTFTTTDHYYYFDVNPPFPTVPDPPSTPDKPVIGLAVSTGALITQGGRNFNFPSAVTLFRQGESISQVPYGAVYLNSLDSSPIVAVKADIGAYSSTQSGTSGYLVSALYFTQAIHNGDGTITKRTSVVGSDNPGWELKSFSAEQPDIPDGHMLSSIATPSSVFGLYKGLGKTPTANAYHSIGSVTFGFKLIDPALKITTSALKNLYIASPKALSLADVHAVTLQSHADAGAQLSQDAALALLQEIEAAAERFVWDEERDSFWKRVDAAAKKMLRAQPG